MANYTYHYFGAYLEIKVSKVKQTRHFQGCDNGHEVYWTQKFCPECGNPIGEQTKVLNVFPSLIVDHLLDEEWEDVLAEITPEKLFGTGVILAIGNLDKPSGTWLYLSQWPEDNDPYEKHFPAPVEVAKMKRELTENYVDVITALREVEAVQDITIKAGYVINQEY